MKKLVVVLTILAVLTVTLAGCKTQNVSTDDRMTISIMAIGAEGDASNQYVTKLLEDRYNIKLESRFVTSEQYYQKRTFLFANGEIPDVIYHLDPQYVKEDVSQDFLAEVDYDLIKKYAPEYVKYINESESRVWTYGYVDGKNYGVPNLYVVGEDPQLMLWRSDWLKKAGINKMPETLDELYETFTAVANADIDGNGQKDTYCMSAIADSYNTGVFADIFGAYGILPFNWQMQNGKVVYGGVKEDMKKVLALLNKWYNEGLIDPSFVTDTASSINTKFQNGELLTVFNQGKNVFKDDDPTSLVSITKQLNPGATFARSVAVKGPTGERGGFVFGYGGHIICFGKHMEDEPEKMQKVLEMIEDMNQDESFLIKLKIGEEGTHYKLLDSEAGLVGGIEYLPPYDDGKVRGAEGLTGLTGLSGSYGFSILPARIDTFRHYRISSEKKAFEGFAEPLSQYSKTDVFMKTDVVPRADEFLAAIRATQSEYIMKIVAGTYPVSKYDEFINMFYSNLKGKELTEEANAFLSVQDQIIEKIK